MHHSACTSILYRFSICLLHWINLASTSSQPNYVFVSDPLQMSDADALCSFAYSTSLASIHNTSRNDEAKSLCPTGKECWIGLNDIETDGTWIWTDGTSFDFGTDTSGGVSPWDAKDREPNHDSPNANCVHLKKQWFDNDCNQFFPSLCNYPPISVIIDEALIDMRHINYIGTVDVLDEIYIEFRFLVSNTSHTNVLYIGSNASPLSSVTVHDAQLNVAFSTIHNKTISFDYAPVSISYYHHFVFRITQSTAVAWLDSVPIYNESNAPSHAISTNQAIYTGAPNALMYGYGVMDSLKIATNNAYIDPFNYLCDYHNRFTAMSGVWAFDPSNCWLTLTEAGEGNVVWLGGKDPSSIQWTDYKIEFVVQLLSDTPQHTAQAGVLFRAQNVSDQNEGGNQYSVDVQQNAGLRLSRFNDGTESHIHTHSALTVALGTDYRVRVETFSDTFHVYLENEHIFTKSDTDYAHGSIGLRVHTATAVFKSLRIIFPDNNTPITRDPTLSPTSDPSNIPTPPSHIPTTSEPSIHPTSSPTSDPTNEPTTLPTGEPSKHPTLEPTIYPSHDPTKYPSEHPTIHPTLNPSFHPTQNPLHGITTDLQSTSNTHVTEESQPTTDHASAVEAFDPDNIIFLVVGLLLACFVCIVVIGTCFKAHNEKQKKQKKYVIQQHVSRQVTTENVMVSRAVAIELGAKHRHVAPNLSFVDTATNIGICMDESSDGGESGSMSAEKVDQSELLRWLTEDVKLPQYYDHFMQNGYDCLLFVKDIDDKLELKEIGITLPGHQTRILKQIRVLKEIGDRDEVNADADPTTMDQAAPKSEGVDHSAAIAMGEDGDSNLVAIASNPLLSMEHSVLQLNHDMAMQLDEFETIGGVIDITAGFDDSDIDLVDLHKQMVTKK